MKSLAFFNEYENLFKKADNICLVHENNKIDEYIKGKIMSGRKIIDPKK